MVSHVSEVERARLSELERMVASLREDSELANALLGLSGALAEVRSLEQTIDLAVRIVNELMGADRCFAASWIPGQQRFIVTGQLAFPGEPLERRDELAEVPDRLPLLRHALKQHAPLMIGGTVTEGHLTMNDAKLRTARAYCGLPLI